MAHVAKGNRGLGKKCPSKKLLMPRNKEIFMITNSTSATGCTRKRGFRILTAVITVLFACSVTVTAFATASAYSPVTVVDGSNSVSISSKTLDPHALVEEAGFALDPNDRIIITDYTAGEGGTIVIERSKLVRVEDNGVVAYFLGYSDTLSDIFSSKGIVINEGDEVEGLGSRIFDGMKVFIKRAFSVVVDADGDSKKVAIANGTVKDALDKAGVEVGEDDVVEPSLDTELNGFTRIRIFRVKYKTKVETKKIAFETETVADPDMFIGEEKIITEGVEGEKKLFYTEKYVDGELETVTFKNEKVSKNPVKGVKKVGTKPREILSDYKGTTTPISELKVPAHIELDENGIPVNYKSVVTGKATAYTGDPATASGRKPMPGHIAVDPKEYPYGTEMYVVSADGSYVYGYCVAADTGGFVEMGNTDIDLYMDNEDMCYNWGNRGVKIYVL